jgi:hypothetical protein
MCNPTRTPPNQIFHLKGFLMDSFTLGPTPKIDFTWTLKHTLATALELADLQCLLKHPLKALWNSPPNSVQNTDLKPPIYRLQETLKTAENRTLSIDRPDESLPRPDGFLRYPLETAYILSLSCVHPDGLTERPDGLHWNPFRVKTEFWSYLNYWISSGRVA